MTPGPTEVPDRVRNAMALLNFFRRMKKSVHPLSQLSKLRVKL